MLTHEERHELHCFEHERIGGTTEGSANLSYDERAVLALKN